MHFHYLVTTNRRMWTIEEKLISHSAQFIETGCGRRGCGRGNTINFRATILTCVLFGLLCSFLPVTVDRVGR